MVMGDAQNRARWDVEACAKACAKQSVKPLVRGHIAECETWI